MPIKNNVQIKKKVNTTEKTIIKDNKQHAKMKYSDEVIGLVNLHHLSVSRFIEPNSQRDNHTVSIDRAQIADKYIEGCIVALGSNFFADKHLAQARDHIESSVRYSLWSTPFVNPDYTATPHHPKPDYTNQCGYLTFKESVTLECATKKCKKIEQLCKRLISKNDINASGRVSIDIDILAVCRVDKWLIIKQRYPFKAHERIGINELINAKHKS